MASLFVRKARPAIEGVDFIRAEDPQAFWCSADFPNVDAFLLPTPKPLSQPTVGS